MLQDSIDLKCPEHTNPETESRLVVTSGWGTGKLGVAGNVYRAFGGGGNENVLKWIVVIFAQH